MKYRARHIHTGSLYMFILTLLIVVATDMVQAQENLKPEQTREADYLVICREPIVQFKVDVRDEAGKDVSHLSRHDFIIHENEIEQAIIFWHRKKISTDNHTDTHYEMAYYLIDEHIDDRLRKYRFA